MSMAQPSSLQNKQSWENNSEMHNNNILVKAKDEDGMKGYINQTSTTEKENDCEEVDFGEERSFVELQKKDTHTEQIQSSNISETPVMYSLPYLLFWGKIFTRFSFYDFGKQLLTHKCSHP